MNLQAWKRNAQATIENQRASEDPSTATILECERVIRVVDVIVPQLTAEEIERITAGVPGIARDMSDVSDIKKKYGFTWGELRILKEALLSPKTTEAQKRASNRYDRANTKAVALKLNKKTDADILTKLESVDNVQGYIKALIRADMSDND